MKLGSYLKDRVPAYIMEALATIIVVVFLVAFRIQSQIIVLVVTVEFIAWISTELWEWSRKRKFYAELETKLEELERKYLVMEVMEEPDFLEGKLLYAALKETDKSMAEAVSEEHRQNKEFREFIELWVHEVKLPLSSLRLMCHNHPGMEEKFLMQIKRIEDYVDNVLYYARSDSSEQDYVIKEVSLHKIASAVIMRNREVLQLIDAELHIKDLDLTVLTDGKWLEYILNQLLSNTLKYKDENRGLKIEIHAEDHEQSSALVFHDNGRGIPSSDLPYIFEKSFTGTNGRTISGSTGMGLYIVKQMCNRLGADIVCTSVEQEFTEFKITFPKHDFLKMQ